MLIDLELLNKLSAQAKASPRLRMNLDLRNSPEDKSQRMLNALEPGTVVPIHRHRNTSETVVCLRGRIRELFYDDNGKLQTENELSSGGPIVAMNVPSGQWHSVECLEPNTVILEMKDGEYMPLDNEDILK